MQLVPLILIRWIVIYLVDSAVQRLNKRGQIDIFCKFYSNIYSIPSLRTLPHQFGMKNHCFPYLLLAKTNQDFCLYTCLLWHSWTCVQSVRLFRLCPKGEKILKGRMTVLNFLSRLQLENYVMTAFSIQPIRTYGQQTIFPHLRVAVVNFQYRWEW